MCHFYFLGNRLDFFAIHNLLFEISLLTFLCEKSTIITAVEITFHHGDNYVENHVISFELTDLFANAMLMHTYIDPK